ncbi:ABC transporter permease [Candidatus Nitrosocosmicus agrestis]|jgi:putative ABC transport system permease protein|uniref:ABC transporter permease n=1 Tax=Candidatus Nitrosocosmicus agrestis TaxID=2563600 RepID=UPI00122E7026|nr:FtsX-like permease family protein [Candidatus Nitrosocosmicus sp. SS]KAA2283612.1 ABC transporter permease [Candidatus Nitrosocosmicus sp. SS]KAF0869694.1 ABC transporter permease [Candidatus Nitrosocosmicus sp. SS]
MDIKEIFILAFQALKERKIRSLLTIVMVMAGTSLLVAVNGVGAGFTEFFNKQFSNLAPNILFVTGGQEQGSGTVGSTGGGGGGGSSGGSKITLNDAVINRIKSLPFIDDVIPSYQSQVTMKSRGEEKSHPALSIDPDNLFVIAPTLEFKAGSQIRQNDPSAIILSDNIANPPGDDNPFVTLGQTIELEYSFVDDTTGEQDTKTKNFLVTGIMEPTGNPTIDNAAVINLKAGDTLFQKSGKFDSLFVVASSSDLVDVVEGEIKKLYGNDIGVTTVKAILKTIKQFTGGITSFLLSIAIISLVVGAVGIITTLYTSVVERIREIGTLKAIGAQSSNILSMFVIEALIIGILGASIGLLGGIAGGYALSQATPRNEGDAPLIPLFFVSDMITVWFISVGLSVIAGLLPAWKASKVSPIEALRPKT